MPPPSGKASQLTEPNFSPFFTLFFPFFSTKISVYRKNTQCLQNVLKAMCTYVHNNAQRGGII